jgi:choline dehydrogenase-like flavoprotein
LSIVDARKLGSGTTLDTHVCIVGAGAAGITLATELASAARHVCLLESGGFRPDERIQALYDLDSIGYPLRPNYMSRARYFGGSCNVWAGRSMLLSEPDMAPRAWVPHSGWPIGRGELAAYYPKAGQILRLPPMQNFGPESHRRRMTAPEQRLFAGGPLVPTVSLWSRSPMRFGAAYKRRLSQSPHVRVVLNASVTSISLNAAGQAVEALTAATLEGQTLIVRAKLFVLACGGLENPRLLLVSRDRQPDGLGNQFDQVGRYFMEHPRGVFGKLRLRPGHRLPLLRGFPTRDGKVQFGVGLSEDVQRREALLNHFATFEAAVSGYTEQKYQSFVEVMKVLLRRGHAGPRWQLSRGGLGALSGTVYLLTPKEILPHPMYRVYWQARELLPRPKREDTRVIVYFCEQPPDPQSRLTLSRETDRLGVNRLQLRWRIGPEVIDSVRRLEDHLAARLAAEGIGRLERASGEPRFTDASHHMGTTRMSDSPRTGVVDRDCRVHGLANLYIAGSSVFPTAGHANPTLTIVALALRLADRLRNPRP